MPYRLTAVLTSIVLMAAGGAVAQARTAPPTASGPHAPTGQPEGKAADEVTVVAVGDLVCAPGERRTKRRCRDADTADLTARIDPYRVIALGDLQYEVGRIGAFREAYDATWGKFKDITIPVPGNHEYNTRKARGYYTYFVDQQPGSPGYYVRKVGAWRVYALNSNCTKINCDAQLRWLRKDIKDHPVTCSLFATHHPRFSSGYHEEDVDVSGFFKVARRHHVEMFLSGHDHDYERFAPMNNARERRKNGVMQFVSGAGGSSHYDIGSPEKGSKYRNDTNYGVLQLTLKDGSFDYAFRGIGGATRDPGSRSCVS